MGLIDDFEKRLEKAVEGVFSKAFRSQVEPSEIGRRLLREMEGGKRVSVSAVYVPNAYQIRLSPQDHERLEGLMPSLEREFVELLKANAQERRWRPAGACEVRFLEDDALTDGKFEVEALHEAGEGPEPGVTAVLALADGDGASQVWALERPSMTIGRASSCEIVLADPNASRQHARVEERDGQWWIADLDTTNGTLVNDALVKERRLHPGDRITIGAAVLEYRENG